MINIVIPMAGEGRRFVEAGYSEPKPFVDVAGAPMIERVLENLYMPDTKFILIARTSHVRSHEEIMRGLQSRYAIKLLMIDKLTDGAACTVLLSSRLINADTPLLIANSDAVIDINISDFINDSDKRELDGSILTFPADHPKWSYAAIDDDGLVNRVVEKEVISPHATAGYYYFRSGREFINSAAEMISYNERVKNEFYVAPAYNYAIAAGAKFGIYGMTEEQMHGLGTPEDLLDYLKLTEREQAAAV